MEVEQLETLLRERETEVEGRQKEIEKQKMEKEHLEERVHEVLHVEPSFWLFSPFFFLSF